MCYTFTIPEYDAIIASKPLTVGDLATLQPYADLLKTTPTHDDLHTPPHTPPHTPTPKIDTHKLHDDLHNMLAKLKADMYEIKSDMVHLETTLPAPDQTPVPTPEPEPVHRFKVNGVYKYFSGYDQFGLKVYRYYKIINRTTKFVVFSSLLNPKVETRRKIQEVKTGEAFTIEKHSQCSGVGSLFAKDEESPQKEDPQTPAQPIRFFAVKQLQALALLGLGGQTNATREQVKTAYKKSILKAHPDKGGTSALFQEVHDAYAVLSD